MILFPIHDIKDDEHAHWKHEKDRMGWLDSICLEHIK